MKSSRPYKESITTNKASGGDGILVELFQILEDNAVKVLHSICPHIWKTQQWPQGWKRPVLIPVPKEGNAKECSNHDRAALISYASKVMLKFFKKLGFNSMRREKCHMYKLALKRPVKLPTSVGP